MCNPGELCTSTGMSEAEMMKLVEQKMRAGVPPPWEWAVVSRCGAAGVAGQAGQRGGWASRADRPEVGSRLAGSPLAASPPTQKQLSARPTHGCCPCPLLQARARRRQRAEAAAYGGAARVVRPHVTVRCAGQGCVRAGGLSMVCLLALCTRPCSSPAPNRTCAA